MDVLSRRRERRADCMMLARLTHVANDYPKWWPEDPEAFIASPRQLGAWVAEDDGVVIGHVALHTPADDPTFDQVRRATGRDAAAVAVVARLFSSLDVRGRGIVPERHIDGDRYRGSQATGDPWRSILTATCRRTCPDLRERSPTSRRSATRRALCDCATLFGCW